jgi:hypothetical protein
MALELAKGWLFYDQPTSPGVVKFITAACHDGKLSWWGKRLCFIF